MNYISFSLNGAWEMYYQKEKYQDEELPVLTENSNQSNIIIKNAVPGYWEDMTGDFKMMPFFRELKINPSYGIQQYPLLGTPPDMSLPNIEGTFFYRRTVNFEKVKDDATIYFAGVQNAASVWVNGIFLGTHEGYSTPFEFEMPDNILKKGKNEVVVSVSNHRLKGYKKRPVSGLTSRAANECTGGITGDVEFRFYNSPLRGITLFVHEDCDYIDVKIESLGEIALEWDISEDGKIKKSGKANGDFSFNTEDLEKWSPENPKLYTICVKCGAGEIKQSFGVRNLKVDGVHFKLNGKPYYLRGICEHCYFPDTIHPNHDLIYYRSIIRRIKELGFNFVRFHTYIPEEEYMQAADELGVLVHVESPNNTSLEEWNDIIKFCRKHPSVVIYCCGNELSIDDDYMKHLEKCAKIVHDNTDALFSPLSALRGVEYYWSEEPKPPKEEICTTPFVHNPKKFKELSGFCDMYSSYANGLLSYESLNEDSKTIDDWNSIYNKPRVSHEICIDGTYVDLSLKDRYKGTRVGKTEMFSSIEKHLEEKGLLKKAPLYFKNSSEWQRRVRKNCFEKARLCNNLAGYDFLGPIDTHWHTFGYDVGMMNEFYELKPGESEKNVLMYNSPTVVLTDIGTKRNYIQGNVFSCSIFTSHFGEKDIEKALVTIKIMEGDKVILRKRAEVKTIENGKVSKVYDFSCELPVSKKPCKLKLCAMLDSDDIYAENEWEIYTFPEKKELEKGNVIVLDGADIEFLIEKLKEGKDVLLLGGEPFDRLPTDFRISLAGRTAGNLATVINDHPAISDMPHDGFCSWQFFSMLTGGNAVCFEDYEIPFNPIIEVVSTHKYVVRQAAMFEMKAINGRLLVCSFNFEENDIASNWLKSNLISYMNGERFMPKDSIDEKKLRVLAGKKVKNAEENKNFAFNPNDMTVFGK